jgi:hypothetical protein
LQEFGGLAVAQVNGGSLQGTISGDFEMLDLLHRGGNAGIS